MKSTNLIISSFALAMLCAGMTASASVVAMDYIGPEGNNSGGVYTYPYNFTLNSSPGTYQLMCDDFTHMINPGDSWNATALNASSLDSSNVLGLEFPSAGVTGYLEACYLFVEEVSAFNASNSDPEGLYNWATWDLLTGSDVSAAHLSPADEIQVQSYLSAAEAAGSSLTPSQFANVDIYTPLDMSSGGPQEFFGYGTGTPAPEPSTLALLGIGAVGLLARRTAARGTAGSSAHT